DHRVRGLPLQALELERATEPDERAGAACAEPEAHVLRRREAREVGRGRRRMEVAELRCERADDRPLDLARTARLDQLAGDRAEQRLRDGCRTQRPQPAHVLQCLAEHRVAGERAQELGVVVVQAEHETDVLDARLAVGRDDDRPVRALHGVHALEALLDADGRPVGAVGDDAGCVAPEPARQAEGVRPLRAELGADHHPSLEVRSADAAPGRVAGLAAEPGAEARAVPLAPRGRPGVDRHRRRGHERAVRRRLDRQLLRGAVSLAGAGDRRGAHRARRVRRRVPARARGAGRRPRSSVRRRRVRPRLLERRRRARRRRARRAAAVRARAVPGREARVRDDAESLVPARGAHAAPVRALAPAGAARAADPVRRRPRSARAEGARGALSLQRACTQSRHDADRGGAGVRIDWRRPVWALHVLIVGLALHNLVMSELWRAGVRGGALTVISAWKDVLLLIALVLVLPRLRLETRADWLAFVFGLFVVVYGLLPQSWLGGGATHKGVLYAARHDLLPVGAYFLGRGL